MFLTRIAKERIDEIIAELGSGDLPEGVAARPLAPIPWLRNTTPTLADVFGLIDGSVGAHIFIDNEGIERNTCIVSHWYCPESLPPGDSGGQEVARVNWNEAMSLVGNASRYRTWFPDQLPENVKIHKKDVPVDDVNIQRKNSEPVSKKKEQGWRWPAHIPKDLKLSKDKPTIISMVHLSESETISLLLEIGSNEAAGPVAIINWPADTEPASNSDIWNIFERIKPDWPSPIGETFFFTIDSFHLSGEEKKPEIIMYSRKIVDGRERGLGSTGFNVENKMNSFDVKCPGFYSAWECCFNPSGNGWSSSVRENDKMRVVLQQQCFYTSFGSVTNPDIPLIWDWLPVFILTEVTATQERDLRAWLSCDEDLCFVKVPKAYSDGTMNGLMKWFQSPDYICYLENPPLDFIAIDSITLAALPSFLADPEDAEKPGFLAATSASIWYASNVSAELATDEVGYVVGRAKLTEPEGLTYWVGFVAQAMGCMGIMLDSATTDQTGAGRYFWDCFDSEDKELAELVETRE
jgi:hypothetical protein